MQKTCKILADCKTKRSSAFNKLRHKIKTAFKPSAHTLLVVKQKSEAN
jgi:hypothetical protein